MDKPGYIYFRILSQKVAFESSFVIQYQTSSYKLFKLNRKSVAANQLIVLVLFYKRSLKTLKKRRNAALFYLG